MINLYIDFDGVIMNTIDPSYKWLKELNIDIKDTERVSEFYKKLNWKKFLNEIEEIHDAFERINRIVETNLFNVNILTHVTSLEEAEAKIHLIRKKSHDITIIPVPKKVDKTKMVSVKDAILIDDYSGNLRKWEQAGGISVRFSLKLNGKGFPSINYLDQIIEFVKNAETI